MQTHTDIPFKIELPFDVWEKSGEAGKERRIGGIISTESKDRHGEVVLQRGLDFTDFLRNGWFNDNHSKNTADILGYPIKVEKVVHNGKPAHKVEGYLLPDYEPADRIWRLARSLQKTGRRLGFSIEGSVRQRTGPSENVIAEALVRNVAVTNCPVNTDTGLDVLAKSMMAVESGATQPEVANALEVLRRALASGSAIGAPSSPQAGDGFALRTESVDRRKRRKVLSKSQALRLVMNRYPGMTRPQAERVVRWAAV
jgi:hypothetical protein